MKKFQLKKLIRESIKELMTEQSFNISNYDCHHFSICDYPLYSGQHVLTPQGTNLWPGWPATNTVGYGQYFSQASTDFWNAVGSPSPGDVVKINATSGGTSGGGVSELCYSYIGNYACYNGGTFYWQSVNSVSPITPSCTDCANQSTGPMGCTDSNAYNYDPNAVQDDGSCDYGFYCKQLGNHPKFGSKCTPGTAQNPGPFQTVQDCVESGCEPKKADKDDKTTKEPTAVALTPDDTGSEFEKTGDEDTVKRMQELANIKK